MAALSYSLAPTFNRTSPAHLDRDQHHIGLSQNKRLDIGAETSLRKSHLANAGLSQMIINPTIPTIQQVREIRGRDSYTAKLVGATTSLTVPPDYAMTQAGTINQ
jgi:hypothetical protein